MRWLGYATFGLVFFLYSGFAVLFFYNFLKRGQLPSLVLVGMPIPAVLLTAVVLRWIRISNLTVSLMLAYLLTFGLLGWWGIYHYLSQLPPQRKAGPVPWFWSRKKSSGR